MKLLWLAAAAVVAMAQHAGGEHMHKRFEEPEKWARNFDDPARDKWQMPGRVIDALALKPSMTVADVGAGTGYFTVRLAKAGVAKVYAVDIEESMVAYTKKRAGKEGLKNVEGVVATAAAANIPEPVDLILIVDTFHHIPAREAYFKGLAASLKSGGRLAIIDWLPGGPMGPPEAFRFSPERIEAELVKAGWKKTGGHSFLPNQSFTVYGR
ncbi:MAG: class I SAM-dependent methyltransferase [Bryobacterales bacterium]|nr:class I SAM-dependent methyltransferase [Bryobacterales bacterium]